jgi:hypothetical protein
MADQVIGLNPAMKKKALENVLNLVILHIVVAPVRSEEGLYEAIRDNWKNYHKQERDELDEDEKRMAMETFYKVDVSVEERYFSKGKVPPPEDLKRMFEDWARTGLTFTSDANNDMVEAQNINAFLEKRCGVKVDEYRENLIELSNLWNEAKTRSNEKVKRELENMSPNKRARLDHVPFQKPTIEIKDNYTPFVNIDQPPEGKFSEDYFHEMIEVLNSMNINYPNKRNNSINNDKLRPVRSHMIWTYNVAVLIAYHLAEGRGDKPLSKTFVNFPKSKKWEYNINDETLREKMTDTLDGSFYYGTRGVFATKRGFITNPREHFEKYAGVGGYMYGWMNKLRTGKNYYVTDEDCTNLPSKAVLTEHYLFLDACGMWDRDNSEADTNANSNSNSASNSDTNSDANSDKDS